MGYHAVELLKEGIGNRLVSIKDDHVVDFGIEEGLAMKKTIDEKLYNVCRLVSK
jgi:6-phosphofructokinase 1